VSRRGRRCVENETEVVELLKKYDFEIIQDVKRSVDEQLSLFQEASVIVTPHGAGLSNLLWCDPGTVVIELFSGSYTPLYYYYICKVMDLDYSYIVEDTTVPDHWTNVAHNINVDLEALQQELDRRFS